MTLTACSTTSFPASMNASCAVGASRHLVSGPGSGDVPGHSPMPEVQAQGWPRQHSEVPLAHPTVASRKGRPSYAGSVVDCTRRAGRPRLAVQHEGRIVASQEAPPRPSILRSFDTRTVHTTVPSRYTNGVIRRSEDEVALMGTMLEAEKLRDDADRNGAAKSSRDCDSAIQKAHPTSDCEMEGRCRRRNARGCPFVGSPVNWAYIEKP